MAKETKETVAENAANLPSVIEGENGEKVNVADLLAQMEAADVGMELGADYFKLEPGESERVIFMEMTEISALGAQGGMTDAVKLLGKDGRFKINADKVIVSTCKALALKERKNVALQITCTGTVKGKKGSYKEFVINELLMK